MADSPLERLRSLFERYAAVKDTATGGIGIFDPDADEMLADLSKRIDRILINHPGLRDVAERHDYRLPDGMPPPNAEDRAEEQHGVGGDDGSQTDGGSGGGGGDASGGDGNGGGGGGGGGRRRSGGSGGGTGSVGAQDAGWKLPGKKGADYEVISDNGKIFVSYELHRGKDGRVLLRDAWRVPDGKLADYGIKRSEAREITKAERKKYAFFGSARDIKVHGDEKHPFSQWKEKIIARHGGTGILKNREVMNILFMGYVEKWDDASIKGAISQTKWWQNSTAYSRRWATELTDKDRETTIESNKQEIKDKLRSLYGDSWQQYIGDGKVGDWAEKIAKGLFGLEGNPQSAMNNWFSQQQRRAEKIMGTPAQVAHDEQQQDFKNSFADPDNMYARLRDESMTALGPHGMPDQDFLKRMARRLASGAMTEVEWKDRLRKRKEALYPFLDPNETWTDRASSYKQLAERLLGTTIGYDDKLLMDLEGKKTDGTRTRQAKSLYDFEDELRNTNRFWKSRTAEEEGQGIAALLNSAMLGIDPGVAA